MSLKERFMRFMQGRYGVDPFSKFLLGAAVVCILLSTLFRSQIISLIGWILLIYIYIRMFSRDYSRRAAENQKFMQVVDRIRGFFRGNAGGSGAARDRDHRIYRCPACGQKTRVPRGKGKIEIECPRCHNKFIKRT